MIEKKKIWDINSPKARDMHKSIGEYLALNFQSFNTVESPGFVHFISKLESNYEIPGRKYFCGAVMASIYYSLKRDVRHCC